MLTQSVKPVSHWVIFQCKRIPLILFKFQLHTLEIIYPARCIIYVGVWTLLLCLSFFFVVWQNITNLCVACGLSEPKSPQCRGIPVCILPT